MPRLILASTSRYRRELLDRLGVPFELAAPRFDERMLDHRFSQLDSPSFALELAEAKGRSLADSHGDDYVLAADQVAVLETPERELLHKPGDPERAIDQLMKLSGRTHSLVTGVVLGRPAHNDWQRAVDRQTMTMRAFTEDEARAYVEQFAPLDCAGSYRIEDAGIRLFETIEGKDYTGIIGLPLLIVCRLLRSTGLMRS